MATSVGLLSGAETKKVPYTAFSDNRRRFIHAIVTAGGFLAPVAGNIYLPALPILAAEFHVSEILINFTVSIFMLVFAITPLFWGAFSDYLGRKPLYAGSFVIFVVANILLATVPARYGALVFLRIVQATGASSVASLGAGTIADIYEPKLRASAISIFMLGPQLGPILGPIIGGGILSSGSWRWIFGFLAILGSIVWLIMLFCLPETLRAKVGNSTCHQDKPWVTWPNFHERASIEPGTMIMKRPSALNVFMLLKYPPITLVSVNVALLFGSYYCLAVTMPVFLRTLYSFSDAGVGASYIVPGAAMVFGSISSGRYADWSRARAVSESKDGKVAPERRIRSQIFGVILFPAGVTMYGWFCHHKIHPAAVLFSTFIVGFSMSWVFATNTTYMTECKPGQAATLVAIASLFRNPAAAAASVIIDPMVRRIGIGWAFQALAFVDLCCIVIVTVMIIFGPKWRAKIQEEALAIKTGVK